jgi:hypothetical protein
MLDEEFLQDNVQIYDDMKLLEERYFFLTVNSLAFTMNKNADGLTISI